MAMKDPVLCFGSFHLVTICIDGHIAYTEHELIEMMTNHGRYSYLQTS